MIVGDLSAWEDLFENDLIPTVFTLVSDAWDRIEKPAPDELEPATSLRLFAALIRGKDRSRHMFLIRYEDVEIDADLSKQTGRKDIVFFPPVNDESIYFCLEAKRLNAVVNAARTSLADKYVKEGMQRFVDGKYARRVRHGAMLGYVLDGNIGRAMNNVLKNIRANHVSLRMDPPGAWSQSGVRPHDPRVKETKHHRTFDASPFRVHHLFVSGAAALLSLPPSEG